MKRENGIRMISTTRRTPRAPTRCRSMPKTAKISNTTVLVKALSYSRFAIGLLPNTNNIIYASLLLSFVYISDDLLFIFPGVLFDRLL